MTIVNSNHEAKACTERELATVLDMLPDPIVVFDERMCVVTADRAAQRLFGRDPKDFRDLPPLDLIHPDDVPLMLASYEEVITKEVGTLIELRVRAADGQWRLVELIGSTHRHEHGLWQIDVLRDVTDRRQWELAAAQRERFRGIVESAAVVLLLLDADGVVLSTSGAMCRQLGHDPARVVGSRLLDWVVDDERADVTAALADATKDARGAMFEASFRHKDGRSIPYQLSVVNLLDDPMVSGLIVSGHDISRRRELEARLADLASHDPLTGLANRAQLLDALAKHRADAADPDRLGVLFIDLDGFKAVNDRFGHDAGDQLLVTIGRRLRATVRATDLVVRLGGDEFVVVCPDGESIDVLAALARRIDEAMSVPVVVGDVTLPIAASVGMVTGATAATADELLAAADEAMYLEKQRRRGLPSER